MLTSPSKLFIIVVEKKIRNTGLLERNKKKHCNCLLNEEWVEINFVSHLSMNQNPSMMNMHYYFSKQIKDKNYRVFFSRNKNKQNKN